ncbi:MAG: hypothetical protein DI537_51965, partial [Stutzerimonas stutzeri]
PTRLDVAFHDGKDQGPVEGFIQITYGENDRRSYLPFSLEGLPLLVEAIDHNPVLAATYVVDNFAEREVAAVDRHIAEMRAAQESATGLMARALPRRIESSLAYRERVLAGEIA